jgi:hypothetical protein
MVGLNLASSCLTPRAALVLLIWMHLTASPGFIAIRSNTPLLPALRMTV